MEPKVSDELEEEYDIEDFGGYGINESQGDYHDDENAGSTEDEEAEAVVRSRAKRKTTLTSKRFEKDSLDAKSKKKVKVLVEVERDVADERRSLVH